MQVEFNLSKLKPLGFVPATGLYPLVSETATHGFRMPAPARGTLPANVPFAGTVVIWLAALFL
jgi:hypothetical protein